MKKVLIAVKEPGKAWEAREVEDHLQVYQKIVGGYIEGAYTTKRGIHIFCNEEGRINGMKKNVMTSDGILFGPVFAVRDSGDGEFASLNDEDLKVLGVSDAGS